MGFPVSAAARRLGTGVGAGAASAAAAPGGTARGMGRIRLTKTHLDAILGIFLRDRTQVLDSTLYVAPGYSNTRCPFATESVGFDFCQ